MTHREKVLAALSGLCANGLGPLPESVLQRKKDLQVSIADVNVGLSVLYLSTAFQKSV